MDDLALAYSDPNLSWNSSIRLVDGSAIYLHKPEFVCNGDYLAICVSDKVQIWSAKSGQLIYDLDHQGQSTRLLQCVENFSCGADLITVSSSSTVRLWNVEEQLLIDTWNLVGTVLLCRIVKAHPLSGYFIIKDSETGYCSLSYVTLHYGGDFEINKLLQDVPESQSCLTFADDNNCCGFVVKTSLTVAKFADEKTVNDRYTHEEKHKLVCIAGHPSSPMFATGNENGKILLWNDVFGTRPIRTMLEWHTSQIQQLAFSQNGTSIFSSASERVVVKWNLNNPNRKKGSNYMPRLGSSIVWIVNSNDSSKIAVSLKDNSILLATNLFRVEQRIQSIVHRDESFKLCCKVFTIMPAGFTLSTYNFGTWAPGTTLISNGRPGELQFYSLAINKAVFHLDVTRKILTPFEVKSRNSFVDVLCVAMSEQWLVTVEGRTNDQLNCDAKLKFWRYSRSAGNFQLNTCVSYAPGDTVRQVAFLSGIYLSAEFIPLCVATASTEGNVNFWTQNESAEVPMDQSELDDVDENNDVHWQSRSVLIYKNLPAYCVTMSQTLNLVAAGFQNILTMWQRRDLTFHRALTISADIDEFVRDAFFGTGEDGNLLFVLTAKSLTIWNAVGLNRLVTVDITFKVVCNDPLSGSVAAFTSRKLWLFKPYPLRTLLIAKINDCMAAAFAPPEDGCQDKAASTLYFSGADQALYAIEWHSKSLENGSKSEYILKQMSSTVNGYQKGVCKSQLVEKESLVKVSSVEQRKSTIKEAALQLDEVFLAPAHTLAPMDVLLKSLTNTED